MLEHVTEVLKGISERPGLVPFGIIMRMDEDGMVGSPVCNFGESAEYWQRLSFGLGVMLSQGRQYLQSEAYLTIIPGLAISVTVLAMNWIGDGLRDAFDPKMRK